MDIANQKGGMVIGTGDMSELALGWATYNGDHMSMYGVNASVPKTLVRHLVRYYADTCGDEELQDVLLDVLDTPVSPELLPPENGTISQKTEDLVGPYELHDFFLYYMLRLGFAPDKIYRIACMAFAGVYDEETILKWLKTFYKRFFAQQFKRSCLPDGPKVGTCCGITPGRSANAIGCIRKDLAREAGGTVEAGMSAFRLFIGCGHSFLQGLCDRTEKNAARIPVFIGKGDLVKWLPGIDLTDERIKGWLNERIHGSHSFT